MASQELIPVLISVSVDATGKDVQFFLDNPTPNVEITGAHQVTFFRSKDEPAAVFDVTFSLVTPGFRFGNPAILFPRSPVSISPSSPTTVVFVNTNAVPKGAPPQEIGFELHIDSLDASAAPLRLYDPTIINNPDPPSGEQGEDGHRGPNPGGSGRAGS